MRAFAFAVAGFLAIAPAHAGPVASIDVYGTDRLDSEVIRAAHGDALQQLADLYAHGTNDEYVTFRDELLESVCGDLDVAFARLTLVPGWGDPATVPMSVTFDVVEHADAARRMPFRAAPDGAPEDPQGLVAAWRAYERRGAELRDRRELPSIACDALHCLFGFTHADLVPFGETFDRLVPDEVDRLRDVLRNDADAAKRASAAYLLAHSRDPVVTAEALADAILDPSHLVRNAAMRVLGQMGRDSERAQLIPLGPILQAVSFPTVYDRNKALTTLRWLIGTPERKRTTAEGIGPELLALLRLGTEANHGPAHEVLRRLSGESHGARDYEAWNAWLDRFLADGS